MSKRKSISAQPTPGEWSAMREGIELQGAESHEISTMIGDVPVTIASVPISSDSGVMEPDGEGGNREYASYAVSEAESLANLHVLAAAKAMQNALRLLDLGSLPEDVAHCVRAALDQSEGRP